MYQQFSMINLAGNEIQVSLSEKRHYVQNIVPIRNEYSTFVYYKSNTWHTFFSLHTFFWFPQSKVWYRHEHKQSLGNSELNSWVDIWPRSITDHLNSHSKCCIRWSFKIGYDYVDTLDVKLKAHYIFKITLMWII